MCDNSSSESEKKYDPYEEYVKDKVSESNNSSKSPFSDPDPDQTPESDLDKVSTASPLTKIGFVLSIASLFCCCCASWQITLAGSIMALIISICSIVIADKPRHISALSIAGIVISSISIILVLLLIYFYIGVYPELMNDPSFKNIYEQIYEQLESSAYDGV